MVEKPHYSIKSMRDRIAYLEGLVEELNGKLKHVQTNHDDLVRRNSLLRDRHDLPVDRLPVHRELVRLQSLIRTITSDPEIVKLLENPKPTAEDLNKVRFKHFNVRIELFNSPGDMKPGVFYYLGRKGYRTLDTVHGVVEFAALDDIALQLAAGVWAVSLSRTEMEKAEPVNRFEREALQIVKERYWNIEKEKEKCQSKSYTTAPAGTETTESSSQDFTAQENSPSGTKPKATSSSTQMKTKKSLSDKLSSLFSRGTSK